jgi:type I restriction enzyme S subunit
VSVLMKDNRVEWLGEVPAHWEIVPPTALFTESKERARTGDQILSATQKYGVIPLAEFEAFEQRQVTKASANLEMRKHVELGDFVISMRSMDGGLERAHAVGSVRSSYSVLKPGPDVDGRFFGLLMKSSLYIQALRLTSNFIRDGQDLNFGHVRKVWLPRPGLDEQAAIANYVEAATARIDVLVAKKTRFIELLRERRQALITHAVTKGLDTCAPMKDSGVEWVGMVPAVWRLPQIKFVAHLGNGSTPARDNAAYWNDGSFPWLTSTCVNQDAVVGAEEFVTNLALNECHLPIIEPPAVLVGITGQGRTRGMATTLRIRATINQHMVYLKPKDEAVSVEYLRYFLDSAYGILRSDSEGAGSTKGAITLEQLANLRVPLPRVEVQKMIVAHLDRSTSRIDTLIAKTERSIELLHEHRSALITAAVTGKIDLHNAA